MKIIKVQTEKCVPCKMVDMMLEQKGLTVDSKVFIEENELITKNSGLVTIVDSDGNNESIELKETVMKSPTVILIDDNNREIKRTIGIDEEGITELFEMAGRL
jgi:hypothetical protein